MRPEPKPADAKERQGPWIPRLRRLDRFPTSCSALSALSQLEQLGVAAADIRVELTDRRRRPWPAVQAQDPPPGTPVQHGREVRLELAVDGLLADFPEELFVSLPGREGREQREAAGRLLVPFDKHRLMALSRLRFWNTIFSGAQPNEEFDAFLFRVLGLEAVAIERARRVFPGEMLRAWARVLPALHQIAAHPGAIARLLTRFLGDPVAIVTGDAVARPLPAQRQALLGQAARGRRQRGLAQPDHAQPGAGGLGQAQLGQAYLGSMLLDRGTGVRVRIGPVAPQRARLYEGLAWRAGEGDSEGEIIVDLGPLCEFERHWQAGGIVEQGAGNRPASSGTPTPDSPLWPRLVYLLEHLLPATATARVHLVPALAAEGWRLGAAPGAAEKTPERAAEPAAGKAAETATAFGAGRLGSWTVLGKSRPDA